MTKFGRMRRIKRIRRIAPRPLRIPLAGEGMSTGAEGLSERL
jgi:hypothetical protein